MTKLEILRLILVSYEEQAWRFQEDLLYFEWAEVPLPPDDLSGPKCPSLMFLLDLSVPP